MNKRCLLTSVFAISFACPAMAGAPVTVPASQFPNSTNGQYVQPNMVYKNSAIINNMGAYGGRILANAVYEKEVYNCSSGTYLPAGSTSCDVCLENHYCGAGSYTYSSTDAQGLNACTNGLVSDAGSSAASDCHNPTVTCESGQYLPAGATACETCPAGYSGSDNGRDSREDCFYTCPSKTVENAVSVSADKNKVYYNGTTYPNCTYTVVCDTNYTASGNGTSNPSCVKNAVTCPAGTYLPAGATSCSVCPENSYCVGDSYEYSSTNDQGIRACSSGKVSPQGSKSAGECGKIMRVGEDMLYLTSVKQTTPALAVKIDGAVYYAKTTALSSGAKPMNGTTTKSLRTKINGIEYSIHDNTVGE